MTEQIMGTSTYPQTSPFPVMELWPSGRLEQTIEAMSKYNCMQIWWPTETDYTRVAETVYTHSGGGTISEVLTNMTVSAGDVIGFFIPRGGKEGLRVAWAPVPDHTLLQGMQSADGVSPVATFSGSPTTLSSSPLVSVIFGKCTRIFWGIPCIVHSSVRVSISSSQCSLFLYVVQWVFASWCVTCRSC